MSLPRGRPRSAFTGDGAVAGQGAGTVGSNDGSGLSPLVVGRFGTGVVPSPVSYPPALI